MAEFDSAKPASGVIWVLRRHFENTEAGKLSSPQVYHSRGQYRNIASKNDSKLQTFAAIRDLVFIKHLLSFHLEPFVGEKAFWKIFSPKMITLNSLVLHSVCIFGSIYIWEWIFFSSITMFRTQVWSCVNNCSFRQSEFAIEKGKKSQNIENLLKIIVFLFGGH